MPQMPLLADQSTQPASKSPVNCAGTSPDLQRVDVPSMSVGGVSDVEEGQTDGLAGIGGELRHGARPDLCEV